MKTKLMMMGALAASCAVCELAAMPTAEETRRAEPAVKRLLQQQRTELRSGRKTRSDVALLAMKRASEAKTEAEKLLLMKGAFALYVQDGNLEKAAETMNVLKKTIPDLPQESVKNMIETALKGAPENVDGERLRKLLGEAKAKNNELAGDGDRMATVDGYTWSYRVRNGEATIVAEKDGKHSCAVSPAPTGALKIPATLGGVKVTRIGMAAFRKCWELTSVTIPEGVTHIEVDAFGGCAGLESVSLPSSLKDIGYVAFGGCIALESVTIPNGVRSIAADAFNGCVKVKSLVIPESVTHIGDRAFCAWHELESVAIPSGVANIGKGVFSDCNALKLINVDSGNQAFTAVDGVLYTKDRSELVMWANPRNAVVIPDGVTKIRGWAFAFGEGMTSVTIPESVTTIDDIVFIGCAGLKSVTIPSRVKSIGEHVFERCSELTEVTMLGERPEAPETLFPGCGKLKAIHVPANAKSWSGMKTWFGIPLVFDGEVQPASEKALNSGNAASTSAGVGDRMATVDGYTWSYRVRNGEATIVAEKDGKHSCAVSPAPTGDLKIPATLDGFKVTGIGWESFRGCKGLKSVTVPEGVTHIDYAFLECADLESVKLPSSLKSIGYGTFARCIALESVTIPNGVQSIAPDAFNSCVKVKSLVIPESVTHIGDRAFCACAALESVAFSSGVVNIGTGVFAGCNALKTIIVDSGNQAFTAVDGVLYTKDRSELVMWPNPPNTVVIPEGVTRIRGWAFAFGEGMTSVTIPESVTSIDEVVFIGCAGLKSVTIPSRVKSIGEHVFERCSELTEVTMLGERPEAPETLFPGCGKLKAIHVPANAKSWAGMKDWFGIPLVFDAK